MVAANAGRFSMRFMYSTIAGHGCEKETSAHQPFLDLACDDAAAYARAS
jgi:hypothetical protein